MPETIRDTSQLESHPAENAVLATEPAGAAFDRYKATTRFSISESEFMRR
jgi:hypothetical protein